MKRVFISQPMNGLSDEEIEKARAETVRQIKEYFKDEEVEIADSFFKGAPHDAKPLWFLGKSFEVLSTCDVAVFAGDWSDKRGCKMEFSAACAYMIDTYQSLNGKIVQVCKHLGPEELAEMHKRFAEAEKEE